jgi:hypothetical protein
MLQRMKSVRTQEQVHREELFLKQFHLGTRRFSHDTLGWVDVKGRPFQNPDHSRAIVLRTDDGTRHTVSIGELA